MPAAQQLKEEEEEAAPPSHRPEGRRDTRNLIADQASSLLAGRLMAPFIVPRTVPVLLDCLSGKHKLSGSSFEKLTGLIKYDTAGGKVTWFRLKFVDMTTSIYCMSL